MEYIQRPMAHYGALSLGRNTSPLIHILPGLVLIHRDRSRNVGIH